MAGEGVGTNIPLNPAKSKTIGKGWKMVIKERGEQPEGGSRKKKKRRKNKREKMRRVFTYIHPLEPLSIPCEYDFYAYKTFDLMIFVSNLLLNLHIVDFYVPYIKN